MPNRMIKKYYNNTSSLQLTSCLSSLLALELLYPSREMFIVTPWVSNVPILNNHYGQYRTISGGLNERMLGLRDILLLINDQGSTIHLMTRGEEHNRTFLQDLPASIQTKRVHELHDKAWVTDHFYLRGSMNFTYNGININSESIEVTTEEDAVAAAMVEARHQWEIT
jgi:hypothetical protein